MIGKMKPTTKHNLIIATTLLLTAITLPFINNANAIPHAEFWLPDPHIGILYMANKPVQKIGEFWDKKHCEFVGKGIRDHWRRMAMDRPYQTTAMETLLWSSVEVKCFRKSLK